MADGGANGLCSQELLDSKISRSLSERVFTRQGAGNIFFLSDCALVTAEFKRKLDYSRKELAQLNQQKQEIAKS